MASPSFLVHAPAELAPPVPAHSMAASAPDPVTVRSARGTRSRAGNAMARGHEAALSGAVRAIAKYGSRATMGDIALMSGIAKATLYNHFRTREELYDAVLKHEIDAAAVTAAAAGDLAAVLTEAAELVGAHPAVRKIAAEEPALIAALATPGDGAAWQLARTKIIEVLSLGNCATPAGVELVLRYLTSQLLAPTSPELRREVARLLSARLPGVPADSPADSRVTSASG